MDVTICDKCGGYTPLEKSDKEQICWECTKEIKRKEESE